MFNADDYGDKYFDLQAQLQSNVSRFAAYKAYHLTQQLKKKREDWTNDDDFKKVAKAMMNTFNRYQAAEYNTATARARTAKQWTDFNSDTIANELYPNLKWLPSRSANPREEHIPFYGLVLPKTDPFWLENQPGNLWNCKCDWEETDDPAAATRPATIHAKGLEGNPAETGEIFTKECTYFKNAGKKGTEIVEDFFRPIDEHHKEYVDLFKNPNYKDVKFDWDSGGMKATHNEHTFDQSTGWYETSVQDVGMKNGHAIVLEREIHTIYKKKNTEGRWDGEPFEIAGKETATPNNIRDGLKHCAKKPNCKVAVLFFPKNNFDLSKFYSGLNMYNGLRNDPHQWRRFHKIICIQGGEIIYEKSHIE